MHAVRDVVENPILVLVVVLVLGVFLVQHCSRSPWSDDDE